MGPLLAVAAIYLALAFILQWRSQPFAERFKRRRLFWLWVIALGVVLAKISEDVLALESGPVDKALLSWIHAVVPPSLNDFFQALTLSASAKVILALTSITTVALLVTHRRMEAALFPSTVLAALLLVYVVKTLVERTRPALWDTQWYWGSSFPSGHTLTSAAFATAACIALARRSPRARWPAFALATTWVVLVASSRLVLGVHWPTDVLAAACAGVLVALAMDAAFSALWQAHRAREDRDA